MTKARDIADNAGQGGGEVANLIINGDMAVAQRGTSTTSANVYLIDRFKSIASAVTQYASTYSQDTDAPSGFSNSLKLTTTTAETTIDAADLVYVSTELEGLNLQTLDYGASSAKTMTLSFWVKSSVTGVYGIGFYQDDGPYNYTTTYTIDTANTWERKTLKITGNTFNTIANDNTSGLRLSFILAAGSTYNDGSASDAWEAYTTDKYASGHVQDGVVTTLNATWQLTGVSLVVGDSAPSTHPYESYAENLERCQRYYYNHLTLGDQYQIIAVCTLYNSLNGYADILFPVQMRTEPSLGAVATSLTLYTNNSAIALSTIYGDYGSANNIRIGCTWASSKTSGHSGFLFSESTSDKLYFDAEL